MFAVMYYENNIKLLYSEILYTINNSIIHAQF